MKCAICGVDVNQNKLGCAAASRYDVKIARPDHWKEMCSRFGIHPVVNFDCELCKGEGTIVRRVSRQIGYTFGVDEDLSSLEEELVECPLCLDQESNKNCDNCGKNGSCEFDGLGIVGPCRHWEGNCERF